MPLSRYEGRFDPDDLKAMQRVHDALCKERSIAAADKLHREELAADIIRQFCGGTIKEAELLAALSKRAG